MDFEGRVGQCVCFCPPPQSPNQNLVRGHIYASVICGIGPIGTSVFYILEACPVLCGRLRRGRHQDFLCRVSLPHLVSRLSSGCWYCWCLMVRWLLLRWLAWLGLFESGPIQMHDFLVETHFKRNLAGKPGEGYRNNGLEVAERSLDGLILAHKLASEPRNHPKKKSWENGNSG